MKLDARVAVDAGVVTEMGPVVAPAGTEQTILPALSEMMLADTPLNEIAVAYNRLLPLIITLVPTRPWSGLNSVIESGGTSFMDKTAGPPMSSPLAKQSEGAGHETP